MNFQTADVSQSGSDHAKRALFLRSAALTVPTALSMMLQVQCPAQAMGNHQPQLMVDHLQEVRQSHSGMTQERRENRQSAHELKLQNIDQARQLHQANSQMSNVGLNANQLQFDLDSRKNVFTLTQDDLQGATSVELVLGGSASEFHAGDRVSAAEYAAIRGGSASSLVLDAKGRADGGSFSLNSIGNAFTDLNISKVVIPTNVTAFGDFSSAANIQLHGDLVNNGSVVTFSTNTNNQAGILNASNIINHHGGSITTANSQSVAGANDNFSLTLDSASDITNDGSIKATGAVNLVAGSGIINNSGTISSSTNNINISSHSPSTAIVINGAGGVFDAANGAINIRSAQDLNAGDVSMFGGDYLSKQLNIYAAQGNAFANVGQVTGDLHTESITQHFYAATDTLTLNGNCITGDPTFVNTAGDIVISSDNSFSEAVAIIASGDINGNTSFGLQTNGQPITLIAGAKVTTTGSQTSTVPGTNATADVVVDLNPAVAPGGSINLPGIIVSTTNFSKTTSAGNITLIALASASNKGGIVSTGLISAQALSNVADGTIGGNVTIIAGANPTVAGTNTINTGMIRTNGSPGSKGGSVTLLTEQPVSTKDNNTLTFDKNGALKSGNLKGSGVLFNNAGISVNGDINSVGGNSSAGSVTPGTSAGAVDIEAGSNITVNKNIQAYGSGGGGSAAGGNGADITLISKNGNISTGSLDGAGGGGGGALTTTRPGGIGGKGGNITVSAVNGTVNVGAILVGDGGNGGRFGNSGGGGGGSYGGGGGGGTKAGGGGGVKGGGGGGESTNGGGGAFTGGQGGAGGNPTASSGTNNVGGNGATTIGGAGGLLGKGGQGARFGGTFAGEDAVNSGSVLITSKGDVTASGGVQGFADLKVTTVNGNYSGGLVNGGALTFQTQTGSFGTAAAKVPTNIATLTVQANPGGTGTTGFFAQNGAANTSITNVALAGRTFNFSSIGSIATASKGAITADTTLLQTTSTINVQTVTKTLTVLAQNGGTATVVNTGDVFLQDSEGNKGFSLKAVAPNASSSAVIHLQGQILNAAGNVTLEVDGPTGSTLGILEESTKSINAASVSLVGTSKGDFGTSAKPLLTTTKQLTVSNFGSVYVQNTGSILINPSIAGDASNAAGSEFVLTTTPNANQEGRITFGNAAGGGITVRGTNSKLTLQSSGNPGAAGIFVSGSVNNVLVAGAISLSDGTGGAGGDNIGSVQSPIRTQANKSLAVNTQGSAFIFNTGNVAILDSKLSAPSTFLLTNTGTITASGQVTAGNLIISSTGDIGTAANPLTVDGANLSVSSSSGSVFINDVGAGTVNLLNQTSNGVVYKNTAAATYSVNAPNTGLLTNAGAISAKAVVLSSKAIATATSVNGTDSVSLTATTDNVSIGQTLTGIAVNITVSGASNIVQNATGLINAGTLTLNLVDGVANLQSANNMVKGLNDTVSGTGQVLLKTVSSCEIGSISGDKQTLTIAYSGTLSTKAGADFSVGPLTFTPNVPTADNSILIQSNITTGNTLTTLTASGKGNLTISATGALLGDGPKNLTVDTGLMSIGGALQSNQILLTTNGGSISQTAAGVITVPGEVSIVMTNAGTAALDVANNVFTTLKSNVTGAGDLRIKVAGDLVLFQTIGSNQKFTVTAAGNIIGPAVGNTVQAKTLSLTAGGAGGIASGGQRLLTNATDITLNATNATGNVFASASSTGVVTLRASSAGGTFDLDSDGSISIAGNIGTAQTNQVTLTANKTGKISSTSATFGISGLSATLASSGGSIFGTAANNGLNVNIGNLTVNTTGSGVVNLNDNLATSLTLNKSSAGQGFTLTAKGPVIMGDLATNAGAAAKTGDINISTQDSLTINNGSNITASGGDINFTAGAAGSITVGANTTILASSTVAGVGDVKFVTGTAGPNTKGTAPSNVVVNETLGGKVFFGTNGITASAPDNTLNAKGRNIIFSGAKAGAISLNGGVTITADPPAGSAAELALLSAMEQQSSSSSNSTAMLTAPQVISASSSPNTTPSSSPSGTTPVSLSSGATLNVIQPTLIPLASQSLGANQFAGATANGQSCATSLDQLGDLPTYTSVPRVIHRFGGRAANHGVIEAVSLNDQDSSAYDGVELTSGNVLCTPVSSAAVLNTKFGALMIAPNSVVLAMATDEGLAVFNLDDRFKNAVILEHGNHHFSVAPGQHLFITDRDHAEFADINVNERILYSNLQKTKLANGHHMYNAQFYIPSVIESVRPLMELVSSKDKSSATQANRLMKTTAILMQMRGGISNYKPHSRRSITAWR